MGLSVGDRLANKYQILKHLGRGSRGDVYLAEDRLLGRKVAVKHLRTGGGDTQADVDRLLAEARTIARLRHENVVTIYDVLEEKGSYYLVLEYANEGTVADLLQRKGRLPVHQALEWGLAAARALEVVHAEGILHGDIKPSNILLVRNRKGTTAKLADFGLARVVAGAETGPGDFSGSVLYAPPEQLHGETIDGRADLYALGAVLYEMLVGQPPFPYAEDVARVIQSHREASPTPPDQLNPDVSPVVRDVVLKALSKAPEERYPDAGAMSQALSRAIETQWAWQERIEAAYARAQEYEQHSKWEQAAACYEEVLAEQPAHAEAQARLSRARERLNWEKLYRQGGQAYDRGAWAEAEEILAQVVTYDPDYASGDAAAKLEEARWQLEMDGWYAEAQDHEAAERWAEATDLYLKILAQESDYKDTSTRLVHAVEQKKRQDLYRKAQEHMAAKDWAEAVKTLQELERRAPDYKDSAVLLERARREKRLHELYTQASQALNEREWASAIEAFRQVLALEPEYADAAVKRAIAERQARLAELYDQARAEMAAEEWANAVATLEKIREIASTYQDVDSRLEEAREKRRLAALYRDAVAFYAKKKWEQAIHRLEQVRLQQPDYQDVEQKLQEAKKAQRLDALYAQARQYEVEQAWDQAIAAYSEMLKVDPNHRDARVGLSRASAASLGRGQPGDVETRERRLAAIGALLVILALSCMLFRPLAYVTGAIFPSPTPTSITPATATPFGVTFITATHTPTPTHTPTATFTPSPTLTGTPTPIPPLSPTPTVTPSSAPSHTPTATPTPSPTPTETPTPSPTPTGTPTATFTPTFTPPPLPPWNPQTPIPSSPPPGYDPEKKCIVPVCAPEPKLEQYPEDGTEFKTQDMVEFKWAWDYCLPEGWEFGIRISTRNPPHSHDYVRDAEWTSCPETGATRHYLIKIDPNAPRSPFTTIPGTYYWNVAVVRKAGEGWMRLSDESEIRKFTVTCPDTPTPTPTKPTPESKPTPK